MFLDTEKITEEYVGIPYIVNGRDISGLDCYGLVHLIYKQELGIELPLFVEDNIEANRIQELINQSREGWEETTEITAGDVVIFKVMGVDSHIALAISPTHFIHARSGYNSAVESFDNHKWKNRFVGSYKYSPKAMVVMNGIPHPLQTKRVQGEIPVGSSLTHIKEWVIDNYGIQPELNPYVNILVNGRVINSSDYDSTIIQASDSIEYRVVPGDDSTTRMILTIAVIAASGGVAGFVGGAAGLGLGTSIGAVAGLAVSSVGMALVDAIAPIRQPSLQSAESPGSAENRLMINGGRNSSNPYGSIPFVLGKVRMTPNTGANSYQLFNADGTESYLRMLLVWGYGPLQVDESSLKIGELPISNYEGITQITLDRRVEPTAEVLASFNGLYGTDKTQVQSGVELSCDGAVSGTLTSFSTSSNTYALPINYKQGSLVVTSTALIYQSTGDGGAWVPVTINVGYSIVGSTATFDALTLPYTTYDVVHYNQVPGPWLNASSTDGAVSDFTIAVNFPNGCRAIKTKGNGSGTSSASPVLLEVEYKKVSSGTWLSAGKHYVGSTPVKDGFTWVKKITYESNENVQVRIRRLTGTGNGVPQDENYQHVFTSTLLNTTFSRNTQPAIDPVNCKIAKTAFEIKATDQLNGSIEGINALVQTYAKVWNGVSWVDGVTSNPAALFRHVLEHPANPRRVLDASSKINLTQLQYWFDYCVTKGFEFNSVVASQRSVLDVLQDICAAGRASPVMIDGKWTVVIDEPKSNIVQHFTEHNSWGFEGTKSLPKYPDGLRVSFLNEDKDYQEDETIVYVPGKTATTAELLESISVPGVTKLSLAQDHARWQLAQAKLRPERYTLNSDIEYIVASRGDRVKVMHSVPMWGLGSGRIKDIITTTTSVYYLDESITMLANVNYSLRVRSKTGGSIIRTIVPKTTNGNYDNIEFTTPATLSEIDIGDLFLFGEVNQEAQDCLVLAVEPMNNKSAAITLVDYGVTSSYNIFTDYLDYTNALAYESNISIPPENLVQSYSSKVPVITSIVSDETVMQKIAAGVFTYSMQVSYTNAENLPSATDSIELQYDYSDAVDYLGIRRVIEKFTKGSITVTGVEEGESIKVRMRYVGSDGRTSQWTNWVNHTIVGKMNPPDSVLSFISAVDGKTGKLKLAWGANAEIDFKHYEVRTDSIWGNPVNRLFLGDATQCFVIPPAQSASTTYYIKAIDYSNNYSAIANSTTYTTGTIPNITSINHNFYDTSTSSATVTLTWTDVIPAFGLDYYEITYGSTAINAASNTALFNADWIGDRTFTIKVVDINGNKSSGFSKIINKALPLAPANATFSINQGTLVLDWDDSVKTTLPIWGYEVRTNTIFGGNDYLFKGAVSQFDIPRINVILGSNTYYIKAIDTDNNYSSNYYTATYNTITPSNISTASYLYADTSLTAATVTLTWNDVLPMFGLSGYEISYDSVVVFSKTNSIVLPANWLGERTFTIKTVDDLGYKSSGYNLIATKVKPNPITNFRSQVIDNTVMFYWDLPAKTSLPIDHVLLKKGTSGSTWSTASLIGPKSGGFTTQSETAAGQYTYYVAAVDTDGNESDPVSITTSVNQPPDFVFFANYQSIFDGTKSSAVKDSNVNTLILPVNTTETFQDHFVNHSWSTPQNQIDAGYPIYIQPTNTTGYYEEIFDYGTILTSSKVTLVTNGTTVSGSVIITPSISVSSDGTTWVDYNGVYEVFATSFRYVKVRVTATATSGVGLYSLTYLQVNLDSKLLNDAGAVSCLSTDTLGTIVNFNKEFVDITSITVSPAGNTAIIPVYEFNDSLTNGTYVLTSNTCTVTSTSHGMITGQKVRLGFSSGTAPSSVYTITSHTTNTFTISITTADTSGTVSIYPESFRIYLFNTSGTRVSATASWSSKGY